MKTENTPESIASVTSPAVVCNALLGSVSEFPMREWINKIRTDFNDGSFFEGNEVQHALVVSFTAQYRGGVKKTEVLEREMVVDWDEYDRQQSVLPNVKDQTAEAPTHDKP